LISSPSPLLPSAASISFSPSSLSTSQPGTVSGRLDVPICPFSENLGAVCAATFSTSSASAKNASTFSVASGVSAPDSSFQTT
jgi:hypothetical protein